MKAMQKFVSVLLLAALLAGLCLPAMAAYTDVPAGAWYHAAVSEVANQRLMDELTVGRFAPDANADRGTVVEALWRLDGKPAFSDPLPFTDLGSARYVDSVRWSYANGVVNGTSDTTFSPTHNVTRAQLTTLLYRYLSYTGRTPQGSADLSAFPDGALVPDWAREAMAWACAAGIIQGTLGDDGKVRLDPDGSATRAQLATVILRFRNQFLDNPAEDSAYENIPGRAVSNFSTRYFSAQDSVHTLQFKYPADWTLTEADGAAFTISRNGQTVGILQAGPADSQGWKTVSARAIVYGGYRTVEYIEKSGAGESLRFRYRYSHEYTVRGESRCLTVLVDASEMGADVRKAMYNGTELKTASTESGFGRFSELEDGTLLILGNSFVSTSKIGANLKDLFTKNGKSCTVSAISRSYATTQTYAQDADLLSFIKAGAYDAVFLCGLYSSTDVNYIKPIKQACDASGTQLILMPAHNEARSSIQSAAKAYPELEILDWKAEIDAFISAGKSKWEFCINDQHLHSTPLAGYIGAHMIYRGIYGEVPASGTGSVTQSLLDRVLGDYPAMGILQNLKNVQITELR